MGSAVTDRRRAEHGLTSSLQFAVIVPVLMLATFGLVQAGLWLHARNVAAEAANAAADVARSYDDDPTAARRTANEIAEVGGLTGVIVAIQRHQRYVAVTIVARAPIVMDLGLGRITETATAPLERVTPP
jgi:Flp pilus assembly protein TadG